MKIEVEIKEDVFLYSYSIGDSERASGKMKVTADSYLKFAEMLRLFVRSYWNHHDDFMNELSAKVWIKKNPDKVKEMLKEK